ncbi:MAG: hypothetical protein QOH76_3423 [Thermoleophilaceae bacterium]|jgi:hypothetical protein|nr:hypothetical protein [Thermoleophilaceae bacterium]
MGKRSRKRGVPERSGAGVATDPTSRAERDAARQRRAESMARGDAPSGRAARRRAAGRTSFEDRPPAPWGKFPLVEIVVLIALVLLVASFLVDSSRRGPMLLGGLALGSLAGLELSIREHFGGFRSHSALLAGAVAAAAITLTYFVTKGGGASVAVVPVVVGGVVFMAAFWLFRQAFARRTGGVGFRR